MNTKIRSYVCGICVFVIGCLTILTGFSGTSANANDRTLLAKETILNGSLNFMNRTTVEAVEKLIEEKYSDSDVQIYELAFSETSTELVGMSSVYMLDIAEKEIQEVLGDYQPVTKPEQKPVVKEEEPETEEAEEEEVVKTPIQILFENKIMVNPAKVEKILNVRSLPSTDGAIIGQMELDAGAEIVEMQDGWVHITSGNVDGWVSAELVLFGDEAAARGEEVGYYVYVVNTDTLNIRRETSTESEIVDFALRGEWLTYVEDETLDSSWAKIQYNDELQAYVASEFVELKFVYPTALTMKEMEAKIAEEARQAANAKVAAAIDAAAARLPVNRSKIYISWEDACLMAAVVEIESGGVSYEGKLAVANVILNRLYGGWRSTIRGVIYQPGQFYGSNNGIIDSYVAKGPNSACLQAVYDACAGYNNAGGYLYFCTPGKAQFDRYASYMQIGNQVFHTGTYGR